MQEPCDNISTYLFTEKTDYRAMSDTFFLSVSPLEILLKKFFIRYKVFLLNQRDELIWKVKTKFTAIHQPTQISTRFYYTENVRFLHKLYFYCYGIWEANITFPSLLPPLFYIHTKVSQLVRICVILISLPIFHIALTHGLFWMYNSSLLIWRTYSTAIVLLFIVVCFKHQRNAQ